MLARYFAVLFCLRTAENLRLRFFSETKIPILICSEWKSAVLPANFPTEEIRNFAGLYILTSPMVSISNQYVLADWIFLFFARIRAGQYILTDRMQCTTSQNVLANRIFLLYYTAQYILTGLTLSISSQNVLAEWISQLANTYWLAVCYTLSVKMCWPIGFLCFLTSHFQNFSWPVLIDWPIQSIGNQYVLANDFF